MRGTCVSAGRAELLAYMSRASNFGSRLAPGNVLLAGCASSKSRRRRSRRPSYLIKEVMFKDRPPRLGHVQAHDDRADAGRVCVCAIYFGESSWHDLGILLTQCTCV